MKISTWILKMSEGLGVLCLGIGSLLLAVLAPGGLLYADEPIKIAAIFSMSGPAAGANAPSLQGVRWAVEEINAAGGVLGRKLALIEIDNLSTPIGAKVAADRAVELEVAAIIGSAWSSHSIAVAKVAQAHGIPMISNISTHPSLTGIGDYIFRVCYNDLLQGQAMAEFARSELKAQSVVICLDLTSDYSVGLSNRFQTVFESLGGKVLGSISYKLRQSNFRETVAMVRQLDPDVLFLPGYDESGRIIVEMMRMGLRAIPMGGDGWDAESFFHTGGDQIASGYYATHWSPAIQTAKSLAFVASFGARGTLMAPAALGYDSIFLLADAMRRAGATKRSAIRDALAATQGFEGVTGSITFNSERDPVKSLVIMQISNGRPHYLMQLHPTR